MSEERRRGRGSLDPVPTLDQGRNADLTGSGLYTALMDLGFGIRLQPVRQHQPGGGAVAETLYTVTERPGGGSELLTDVTRAVVEEWTRRQVAKRRIGTLDGLADRIRALKAEHGRGIMAAELAVSTDGADGYLLGIRVDVDDGHFRVVIEHAADDDHQQVKS